VGQAVSHVGMLFKVQIKKVFSYYGCVLHELADCSDSERVKKCGSTITLYCIEIPIKITPENWRALNSGRLRGILKDYGCGGVRASVNCCIFIRMGLHFLWVSR